MNQKRLIKRLCEEGVNHLLRGGDVIVASSSDPGADQMEQPVNEKCAVAVEVVDEATDVPSAGMSINDKIETSAEIVHSKWALFETAESEIRKVWTDTTAPEKTEALENLRLVEAGIDRIDDLMKYEFSTNYFSKKMNEVVTAKILLKIGTQLSI